MNGLVNWAAISELSHPAGKASPMNSDPAKMWGAVARMYNKMAQLEREYTQNQLDALIITKEDTVLDVGCGPGFLCRLPVWRKVSPAWMCPSKCWKSVRKTLPLPVCQI